jgi:hypothetical protein
MRKIVPTVLLIACAVFTTPHAAAARKRSASATDASTPESVVRGFYAWYLGRLNKDDWSPLKRRVEALKYLDANFHRKAPRLIRRADADIFICAQDWMKEWEKNFKVAPAEVRGARASTIVTLPVKANEDIRIKVMLRRTGGVWKIVGTDCMLDFEVTPQ